MIQSGEFLGTLLGPLLKTGLPLIKNVIKPLPESVLIPLALTAATSAADAGIHKKILASGHHSSSSTLHINNTILITSNDEMKKIVKIVESLENSSLLPVETGETIQNEAKEQRRQFLSILLGMLGASLLGYILTGKGINRAGEGIARASYGNKKGQKIR